MMDVARGTGKSQVRARRTDGFYMRSSAAASTRRRRAGLVLVLVVLLAGAGISAGATLAAGRAEERYADQAMDRYTDLIAGSISDEVAHYGNTLLDAAAAIGVHPGLTRTAFTAITANLTGSRLRGASSLALVVSASDAQTPAVQRYWRGRGADGLELVPARPGVEHHFVVFSRSTPPRCAPGSTWAARPRRPRP
jgi:hypothetical protein